MVGLEFTNAFELMLDSEGCGRAIFALTSRLNHACSANLVHTNVMKEDEDEDEEGMLKKNYLHPKRGESSEK